MHNVADPDIERTGVAHHDDLRAAESAWGTKERQDRARGNDDHREDDTGNQRKRLRAKRIVEHPNVAAHQRVLHSAQQESISADMQPRR